MASIFDFITGRNTPPAPPPLGAIPAQPSLGARFGAAFKRRLGDTIGAFVDNPVAKAAGDFAGEYWDGNMMSPVGGAVAPPAGPGAVFSAAPAAPGFGFTRAPAPDPVAPIPTTALGALPPVAPMTPADMRGNRVPVSGTGAIMNNRTGAVTNLDTRASAPVTAESGFGARPLSWAESMGAGAGAELNQRREAATDARRIAEAKILADVYGKGPAAAKAGAEANRETLQTQMSQEYLKANPGDYAGAAGIASGRPIATDKFGAMPSMTGNDLITYNKSTGASRIQTPIRPVSAANIDAAMTGSMKGKTRAQVIQAYKDKGYDVSGIK